MPIAYLIPAEGDPSKVEYETIDLSVLKSAIGGGWVQAIEVRGFGGGVMWMDEESKIKRDGPLPLNVVATALCRIGRSIFDWDTINGDVIVTGAEDPETGVFSDVDSTVGDALEALAGVEL